MKCSFIFETVDFTYSFSISNLFKLKINCIENCGENFKLYFHKAKKVKNIWTVQEVWILLQNKWRVNVYRHTDCVIQQIKNFEIIRVAACIVYIVCCLHYCCISFIIYCFSRMHTKVIFQMDNWVVCLLRGLGVWQEFNLLQWIRQTTKGNQSHGHI